MGQTVKIDCRHVWEHISEYIDGDVGVDLKREIDRHLSHCAICSATMDSTRNIVVLMADERVFEIPGGYSERLHERLDAAMSGV
jgi:anti-sigma factor RsiW